MEIGGKVSRNAPDNDQFSNPSFTMSPWLVLKACIQSDPGGKQRCFRRDSEERPTPYSLVYMNWGDQHLVWGPEGIEDRG